MSRGGLNSRYELRLSEINILVNNAVELNAKLNDLEDDATLTTAKGVVQFAEGIKAYFVRAESGIKGDIKANWISETEGEHLLKKLDYARGLLNMLEVEV